MFIATFADANWFMAIYVAIWQFEITLLYLLYFR